VITHLVFDLADTLIAGLTGIENTICNYVKTPKNEILKCFRCEDFGELMTGEITENEYLDRVLVTNKWNINVDIIKKTIRNNFIPIVGMPELVDRLNKKYTLSILSNHCKEWILYMENEYPFMNKFLYKFYSFNLRKLKDDKTIYIDILHKMNVLSANCLYIDDRENFIQNARNVGIQSILFTGTTDLINSLTELEIM
jgi:FMN phosphatase YigB (HAD superfamily)